MGLSGFESYELSRRCKLISARFESSREFQTRSFSVFIKIRLCVVQCHCCLCSRDLLAFDVKEAFSTIIDPANENSQSSALIRLGDEFLHIRFKIL